MLDMQLKFIIMDSETGITVVDQLGMQVPRQDPGATAAMCDRFFGTNLEGLTQPVLDKYFSRYNEELAKAAARTEAENSPVPVAPAVVETTGEA